VINEVEGGFTGADPGLALRVGKHVYRGVKRSLLGPGPLALIEHTLAHDVGTDPFRGVAKHVIDWAGLSPWTELEVLAEVLLVEDPARQRTPLGPPVLVLRGVPMLHGHSFRCHVAIEAKRNVDEHLAHDSPHATRMRLTSSFQPVRWSCGPVERAR